MERKFLLGALFIALALAHVQGIAQTPTVSPTPASPVADQDSIVRITTNLIQVDASVVDKNGKPLPNLRSDDFEILVNGKPQRITTFSFLAPELPAASNATAPVLRDKTNTNVPPVPTARLRPEQVRRSIAMVVDDLNMSPPSITYARRALRNFVDVQMEPGDLVAIVRVGRGSGVLQRFTADKRELYAAIEKIKYNLAADRAVPLGAPDDTPEVTSPLNESGPGIQQSGNDELFFTRVRTVASLSATDYVVRGMRELPGRKAVLLISDGFPLSMPHNPEYGIDVREAIRRLVDDATRSGVVISTMASQGLIGGAPSDAISSPSMTSSEIAQAVRALPYFLGRSQDGLRYLAKETGGLEFDGNDMKKGIREVLDDLRSYYLIGFQPDASVFDQPNRRFNQLKVNVKVPGVKVRYRSGFFGIKDRLNRRVALTSDQQIVRALTSPFGSTDISVRLTPLFTYDPKTGPVVRSLVHISTNNLTFVDQPQGGHQAVINIVARTFDSSGLVVDAIGEIHTLSLPDEIYRRGLASGFVYSVNVPIKKSGDYQLRVAVQDAKSAKVGTASQFITIPDVKKGRLSLSGIALSSYEPRQAGKRAADENAQSTQAVRDIDLLTKASLRRFHSTDVMQFAYSIYNPTIDKTTAQPYLVTLIKIFRDGKEVHSSQETPFDPKGQSDLTRLVAQGTIQLGGLEPGDYVLQTIVTDVHGRARYKTATTWMDFEVVK